MTPPTLREAIRAELPMEISMTRQDVEGMFGLAHIGILKIWQLPNGYLGPQDPPVDEFSSDAWGHWMADYRWRFERPWWLVQTPHGLIEIGWRKRVILIDWSETRYRGEITVDDVTKNHTMVHAWSIEKAVEYLRRLRDELERLA